MSVATARTALDLRATGWKGYHPAARPVEPAALARRRRAWKVAREAAHLLRESFGATEVAVFGSIVDQAPFGRRADIDLAIWGVPEESFYRAVAAVTGMSSEFEIDVIDAKAAPAHLQKAIETESKLV